MSRIAIAVVALLASASVASAQQVVVEGPNEPAVITSGRASIKRAPDRALITISTDVRDAKPGDARQKSANIMTAVQNALKATGLPADAIRTTAYSMNPEMVSTPSTGVQIRGYSVFNQIEVRVDDLDKLGQVIDAVQGSKQSGMSISGPRFELRNREAVEQDALRLAVEYALLRAQAMATGARRTLGPVLRVDDQLVRTELPVARTMAATAKTETPITPGQVEVTAEVTVWVGIR
jgi:uncharacterized protein YggE